MRMCVFATHVPEHRLFLDQVLLDKEVTQLSSSFYKSNKKNACKMCVWRRASLTSIKTTITVIVVFLTYILLLWDKIQRNLCDLQRRLAICF